MSQISREVAFTEEKGRYAVNSTVDELESLFREIVLVLGGVFAFHPLSDEALQRIAHGLERAYRRRTRCSALKRQSLARFPHPALARLLRLARSGRRGN